MSAVVLLAMATPQERFFMFAEGCVLFIAVTVWWVWRAHRRR